jgi:hypothetical protein
MLDQSRIQIIIELMLSLLFYSLLFVQEKENENSKADSEEQDSEEEEEIDGDEGFVLDRNVVDAVFPDLTDDFGPPLQKVRDVVKFFREIFF